MKESKEIPQAYIEGSVEFLGSKIDLSYKPLIPRDETEWWVEEALKEVSGGSKCLDIFSGSGCIGISLLRHIASSRVDFVDIEDSNLKQIKLNCGLSNIDEARYKIIKSDIFENVSGKYDYIFSNPPYVAESRRDQVQDSVLDYEPHTALFSGGDGLDIIRKFLREAKSHLNQDGVLYMEFDDPQRDEVERLLKLEGYSQYKFFKDQFKKWRSLRAQP